MRPLLLRVNTSAFTNGALAAQEGQDVTRARRIRDKAQRREEGSFHPSPMWSVGTFHMKRILKARPVAGTESGQGVDIVERLVDSLSEASWGIDLGRHCW